MRSPLRRPLPTDDHGLPTHTVVSGLWHLRSRFWVVGPGHEVSVAHRGEFRCFSITAENHSKDTFELP